jgi:hypothetical protein
MRAIETLVIDDVPIEIEHAAETFELAYLPPDVSSDFGGIVVLFAQLLERFRCDVSAWTSECCNGARKRRCNEGPPAS